MIAQKKLIDLSDVNIDDFRQAAIYFKKHKKYPKDPDFEDEEYKRVTNGYKVGNFEITNEHYSYLNYCQIDLTDDPDKHKLKKALFKRARKKGLDFPDFWDGDYIFFWLRRIARFGASDHPEVIAQGGISLEKFESLRFPPEIKIRPYTFKDTIDGVEKEYTIYGSGKNFCLVKKRRWGASFKYGHIAARKYHFEKKSLTLLCAYDTAYLQDEGIMAKCTLNIDFIDGNTAYRRRRLSSTADDYWAGYKENIDGTEVKKGSLSRVLSLSFRNNTGIARGKSPDEVIIDESGKAPNLQDFTDATIDALGDGVYSTGMISWLGTGGGENINWEAFKEIFYNPSKYNCLEFENTWDEGALGTYCGFFVPDYWNVVGYMTDKGESLVNESRLQETDYQQETYINKGDMKGLVARQMEHPHTPAQAFAVSNNNIYDVHTIRAWRYHVERENLHNDLSTKGKFLRDENGKLTFKVDNSLVPLWDYPIDPKKNNSGCVLIWHEPIRIDGKVPKNMYIIDADTYRFDTTVGNSVASFYVYLRPTKDVPLAKGNKLVASFIGRPTGGKDIASEICFQLAEYYNAEIGFENDDSTLVDYAKRYPTRQLISYLAPEFQLAYDERLRTDKGNVRRKFGMHMGSGKLNERKITGDEYNKEWIEEVRSTDEDGNQILTLHTIYDIGLLKEFENYSLDRNFDRLAALRVQRYHSRELVYKKVEAMMKENKLKLSQHRCFV